MSIKEKAILVSLSISMWTNKVQDEDVVDKLVKVTGATKDSHQFKKVLIKPEAMLQVRSARIAVRAHWWNSTLPWGNSGIRLLPASNHQTFAERMRELEADYARAVAEFCRNYPKMKAEARQRLKSMFKEDDFPTMDSIKNRFGIDLAYLPIPDGDDFRVKLSEDEMKEMRKSVERDVQMNMQNALGSLVQMMQEVVGELASRLKESDPTIRQSLITNVAKVCEEVQSFNLVDDKKIETLRKSAETLTKGVDIDTIKTDKKARKALADKADDVLAKMAAYTGSLG